MKGSPDFKPISFFEINVEKDRIRQLFQKWIGLGLPLNVVWAGG